jgi:DNA-binding MarR family transcriptional regulator
MPSKPDVAHDTTPFGRLSEAALRRLVGYQLAQATITTSQVFEALAGQPCDLRPVEFTILTLVHENPDVSASQLARALAVTSPNIKLWIDRLAQRELVERVPSPTDRRAQHLRTTARGAALAGDALARLLSGEQAALAALSVGEQAILVELLHKVARCRRKPA